MSFFVARGDPKGSRRRCGVAPPEAISPARVFPKMTAACHSDAALFDLRFLDTQRANRGRRLRLVPV
jgi:hypothetical protein